MQQLSRSSSASRMLQTDWQRMPAVRIRGLGGAAGHRAAAIPGRTEYQPGGRLPEPRCTSRPALILFLRRVSSSSDVSSPSPSPSPPVHAFTRCRWLKCASHFSRVACACYRLQKRQTFRCMRTRSRLRTGRMDTVRPKPLTQDTQLKPAAICVSHRGGYQLRACLCALVLRAEHRGQDSHQGRQADQGPGPCPPLTPSCCLALLLPIFLLHAAPCTQTHPVCVCVHRCVCVGWGGGGGRDGTALSASSSLFSLSSRCATSRRARRRRSRTQAPATRVARAGQGSGPHEPWRRMPPFLPSSQRLLPPSPLLPLRVSSPRPAFLLFPVPCHHSRLSRLLLRPLSPACAGLQA